MNTALMIIFFLFGTIIGSFLNVVILRYRSGRTLQGRSMCFSCGKTLTWFELVPIGSFLTQKGKCAGCGTRISWQYPVVEAITGFLFVALYVRFEYLLTQIPLLFAILFAYYAFIFCLLLVMSVYDLKHKILPDGMTMLFASVTFIGMFLLKGDALILHIPNGWDCVAGLLLPAPFSLLWLASKGKWMGLGDAKLMIGIGFMLGLSTGTAAILLSFWVGAGISLLVLLGLVLFTKQNKVSLKTAIPFGPFLAFGTFTAFLFSVNIESIMRFFAR
ncbi:MAG: prepilin peptidase [bacterium]